MKIIKGIILCVLLLFITGCGNKELEKVYNNMQIGKDGINGYKLNLRIYGTINNKNINEIVRVTNYNNKEFQITKANTLVDRSLKNRNSEEIYIKDGKTYIADKNNQYIESNSSVDYKNPNVYLTGLKNTSKINKKSNTKVGENSYTKYEVTFKKSIIINILKDTAVKKVEINKDVTGEIYVDKDNYVYRIIYIIDDLTINANYYSIDNVKQINIPNSSETQR